MRPILIVPGLALALLAGPALARPPRTPEPAKPASLADPGLAGMIEAKAAQEAERQAVRNARFDAQVKRITGTICQGCVAAVPAHPKRR